MTLNDKPDAGNIPLSPLKQAFLAMQAAQARADELERERSEPIAIVGMGCRVPGAGEGPDSYWKLLMERRVAVSDGVERRFAGLDRMVSLPEGARWAGLLDQVDGFDPQHFGISPREAAGIDPQQRLLLETCWQALEDAGIDPFSLYKSQTGVFVGICTYDYGQLQLQNVGSQTLNPHFASGIASSVASGRIAYVLGLNGPTMSIDTACSSSLVAVHLACAAIRRGECSVAISCGVNLILAPEYSIAFAEAGMLSPHGVCRTFDGAADGYVRGEGCGVIVLKRLRDAEANGDRILAVIRGSAINQDGATSGLTVPNGQAQQALLRQAHANAGVEAWQVGYVEAHGTGTSLGDPIEAEALGAVFRSGPVRPRPLVLGAVKANIGHLEGAAGIIGLIKVVLTLQHEVIPGHPHLNRLNPHVRWAELPLEVARETQPWPEVEGRRIAGVSSFGFSGTNAHVVLEGTAQKLPSAHKSRPAEVLALSARTIPALRQLAEKYAAFLDQTEATWSDICNTAAMGRAVFGERLAVVATDKAQAAQHLRQWLERDTGSAAVFRGRTRSGEPARPALSIESSTKAEVLAEVFVHGAVVDWQSWAGGEKYRRVALPGYPFQRERYWVMPSEKKVQSTGKATGYGLLGNRLPMAGVRAVFETQLSVDGATDWIGDHVLDGRAVFPLTGYVELMLEAGQEIFGCAAAVEDLVLLSPLVIDPTRTMQVVAEFEAQGRSRVRAYAAGAEGEWQKIAEASLRPATTTSTRERVDLDTIRRRLDENDSAAFYTDIRKSGATFGPRFQGIARLWSGTDEALGEVGVRAAENGFIFAPWRLDACLQLIGAVRGDDELYLPGSVGEIQLYGAPGDQPCWSHLRSRRMDASTLAVDITVAHPDGTVLAVFRDILFRKSDAKEKSIPSWFYRVDWKTADAPAPEMPRVRRVAMVGSSPRMRETAACLRGQGIDVVTETSAHSDGVSPFSAADVVLCFTPSSASGAPGPGDLVTSLKERVQLVLESAQELLRSPAEQKPRLYVVSENACVVQPDEGETADLLNAPVAGMASAIALEVPELRCTLIDAAGHENGIVARQIASEVLAGTDDLRVAFRAERRYTAHLERVSSSALPPSDGEAKSLSVGTGIEGLKYETTKRSELKADEVEIEVRATALNFRDVLKATGLLEHAGPIGADCSGVIARVGSGVSDLRVGDQVVAIAPGCFATHVVTAAGLAVQKPEVLSFENAAAQTIAYLTVDYCLHELAHIRRGDRVLIHAAAGGVGLAAVHMCRRAGAEVVATAGNEEKGAFLRNMGIEQVLDSRSLAFKDQISGGVDIVLNSLAGAAVDAGLSLLRPGGRFIELGKTDVRQTDEIARNWPGISYRQADLTPLIAERSPWLRDHMSALLNDIAAGELPTLPLTIFEEHETKQAFRYMAGARHIGRIVIRSATRELAGGTHLITGGMRGLGLRLAEWLVERGARDLVLTGRNPASEESSQTIANLEAKGARVRIHCGDVAEVETVRQLIAQSGDALRGVWHCAGVTHDAVLAEQNWATCAEALRAKAEGAWNLHLATREMKPEFFVMFSSWASLAGSRGQANYCAANAFLDALARTRVSEGLQALSVNWGAWGETGMATSETIQRHLARSGMEIMRPEHGFLALEAALYTREPRLAIAPIDWPKYLSQLSGSQHSFYADLIRESPGEGSSARTAAGSADGRGAVLDGELSAIVTAPIAGRTPAIQRMVEGVLRRTLGLPSSEEIDPDKAFSDLGMDSLLAVELRNNLSTILQRRLPSTLVFDHPTPQKMVRFIEQELFPAASPEPASENALPAGLDAAEIPTPLSILDEIEGLSDEEVDSIFENRAGH